MNYFEKHIGDYISDTVSLTMLEEGAYTRLMDQSYQTERPLPLDKKMIYRLARATSAAERKAVDFVVDTFFMLGEDGYTQKRIQIEIERFKDKQRKAQASANARWSRSEGNANASKTHDAPHMRTHSEGNALQTPDTSNHTPDIKEKKKKISRAALKTPLPDGFGITPEIEAWAKRAGHGDLQRRLEHFVGCAKAKGYVYADWEQAFQNAVREDWAKLLTPHQGAPRQDFRQTENDRRTDEFLRLTSQPHDDGMTFDMEQN